MAPTIRPPLALDLSVAVLTSGLLLSDYGIICTPDGAGAPDGTAANERIIHETPSWRVVVVHGRRPLIVVIYKF